MHCRIFLTGLLKETDTSIKCPNAIDKSVRAHEIFKRFNIRAVIQIHQGKRIDNDLLPLTWLSTALPDDGASAFLLAQCAPGVWSYQPQRPRPCTTGCVVTIRKFEEFLEGA